MEGEVGREGGFGMREKETQEIGDQERPRRRRWAQWGRRGGERSLLR
jgi:hypothetical protein